MRFWDSPVRPLPVAFPPVHGEVLGWYLHRLAEANCTTPSRIAQSLVPLSGSTQIGTRADGLRNWGPDALTRLSIMTGTSTKTLVRSLPGLARLAAREHGEIVRLRRDLHVACPHCVRRRGITEPVLAHLSTGSRLCAKHGIWLDGNTHYRLLGLPEVVQAQRRHRRLAERFPDTIENALLETHQLVSSWLGTNAQPALSDRWQLRLAKLPHQEPFPHSLINRGGDDRRRIITYPEVVTMLRITADPHWRAHRIPDSKFISAENHRKTMDAVFSEAERLLAVPTLRTPPRKRTFNNDPLFRWTDPRGRVRFSR